MRNTLLRDKSLYRCLFSLYPEKGGIPMSIGQLPKLPDYDNCLVNLANSVLDKFGVQTTAPTLPLADRYLTADRRNVVVLILDAMGTSIIEKHLDKDGFFRSHFAGSFDSVYPPTTVAATTSLISGLYPDEHGWLGWDMYYPQLDKNVTVFLNTDQMAEKENTVPAAPGEWDRDSIAESAPAADYHAGYTFTPYKSVIDKINDAGGQAYYSMPFMPPFPKDPDAIFERIAELCEQPGRKYIYAYWNEPDTTMHKTGTESSDTHEMVRSLEKKAEEYISRLSDTLFIITADHGHMDSNNLCILDYPEITDCLVRLPSIEPRTLNMFVKEERREDFPVLFRKAFGDKFVLLTREEVLSTRLFGIGNDRDGFADMIGDFVAVAVSDTSVFNTHYEAQIMPGGHAGLTPEEYTVPLIVIDRE